ncbi:MAG TPA: bifunctional 3,4-dihydroxy-2-butanone-4-phosphate synthase/GTP cyclohydrolase II, partial [Paralcaligenes sp.]
ESRPMQTPWGEFQAVAYRDLASGAPHLALVHGSISPDVEALVRVHEPTSLLDVLSSGETRHSWSISQALKAISAAQSGVLVLLNCQGSAELLFEQFADWNRSGEKEGTSDESRFDFRTYGIGAQILRDLNVGHARLLARPRKMPSMAGFSLTITGYDSEPLNTP